VILIITITLYIVSKLVMFHYPDPVFNKNTRKDLWISLSMNAKHFVVNVIGPAVVTTGVVSTSLSLI